MNARLIRIVAAVASVAVVSVLGAGMADASTADRVRAEAGAVTGHSDTHSVGQYLQQLRDYVAGAVDQDDVAAVEAAINNLRPALGAVSKSSVERAALVLNDRVDSQAAQVERDLPGLGLLAPVSGLLTSLLATLMDLVTSLLGGLPVPVPVPELPVPLPEVPGVPTPDLPVPAPDVPAPPVPPAPPAPQT